MMMFFSECPVLGEQSTLGFAVLALQVLCHAGGPAALVVALHCLAKCK